MLAVTGGSGALGRRIVDELARDGAPFVVGTRSGHLSDAPPEAVVRAIDFADPAGMRRALEGVDHLLIVSTGAPVDERIRQHTAAIDAAVDAGVGRILYTSFIDNDAASPFPFAVVHARTEEHLVGSPADHLVLRNGQYADRFAEFLPEASARGILRLPIDPDARASFVGRSDLALAAAAALRDGELRGIRTLTGASTVSYREATELMAAASGAMIRFETSSPAEYVDDLVAQGWPIWEAQAFAAFFDAVAEGRTSAVTEDVFGLLGREPVWVAALLAGCAAV